MYVITLSVPGKYIYIEASRPRKPNDNAKLSFTSAGSGRFCMTFYYHMYGKHIGTLKVYSGSRTIFTLTGNQGNAWKKADLDITASGSVSAILGFVNRFW